VPAWLPVRVRADRTGSGSAISRIEHVCWWWWVPWAPRCRRWRGRACLAPPPAAAPAPAGARSRRTRPRYVPQRRCRRLRPSVRSAWRATGSRPTQRAGRPRRRTGRPPQCAVILRSPGDSDTPPPPSSSSRGTIGFRLDQCSRSEGWVMVSEASPFGVRHMGRLGGGSRRPESGQAIERSSYLLSLRPRSFRSMRRSLPPCSTKSR
jgi:hypothetical protein